MPRDAHAITALALPGAADRARDSDDEGWGDCGSDDDDDGECGDPEAGAWGLPFVGSSR